MEIPVFVDLIAKLGFPIACVIGLGVFIVYIVRQVIEENNRRFDKIQEENKIRENKLFEEIKLNREVNAAAIETIAKYAERLEGIEGDIEDIKTNLTVLSAKVGK